MDKLRWKMQNFMRNRNGSDELCRLCSGVAIVLYIVSLFVRFAPVYYLALLLMIYSLFRMFSRNVTARREENRKFLNRIRHGRLRYEQRKEYKFFGCKSCGRQLRVPRGKGKVEITCPICGRKSIHRT